MTYIIRELRASDRAAWAAMRAALWPEEDAAAHGAAIDTLLRRENAWSFVAETAEGQPLGFAEVAIRPYANGCESQPIAFLEGIWIDAPSRRHGIGRRLIDHVEAFLLAHGFRELGSDTPLDNLASQDAHRSWGFDETERVIYFRRRLRG
ncbi:MAG TPA: GNAT family N-acetyltransferase [Stellaceae bacterium]